MRRWHFLSFEMKKRHQKRLSRDPYRKVSRKTRKVPKSIMSVGPTSKWDPRLTQVENYAQLGIVHSLNKPLRGRPLSRQINRLEDSLFVSDGATMGKPSCEHEIFTDAHSGEPMKNMFREILKTTGAVTPSSDRLQGEYESAGYRPFLSSLQPSPTPKQPKLTPFVREYIGRLVSHYGNNVQKMALDTSLNYLQWTRSKLEKLVNVQ